MQIGDTITVSYEESKKLRRQGWKPRNDVVIMTYVGKPEVLPPSNRSRSRTIESPASASLRMRRYRAKKRAEASA